jgi:hypothetical protein
VRPASERSSGLEFGGIEIYVGMEVSELVHTAKIACHARTSRAGARTTRTDLPRRRGRSRRS